MPAQASTPIYSEARPTRLWVRLAPSSVEKLDRYAEHQGITRAGLLHKITKDWLDAQPEEPDGPRVRSERIYDRSEYMQQRIKVREQVAAAAAAERVLDGVQNSLRKQWLQITQALEDAKSAITTTIDSEEGS